MRTKPGKYPTFCPECGFGVTVDEDGLCIGCGSNAIGTAVEALLATGPKEAEAVGYVHPEDLKTLGSGGAYRYRELYPDQDEGETHVPLYLRLQPPILHERDEDGNWICCCGDHLGPMERDKTGKSLEVAIDQLIYARQDEWRTFAGIKLRDLIMETVQPYLLPPTQPVEIGRDATGAIEEICGYPVVVQPFVSHVRGTHAIVLIENVPWLVWKHPDGQWVTACPLDPTVPPPNGDSVESHATQPERRVGMKPWGWKGWFAEYKCGCLSDDCQRKKDILEYCPKHGADIQHIHRHFLPPKREAKMNRDDGGPAQMLDDKREIAALFFEDGQEQFFRVGTEGVTRIVAYGEPGEYCNLPWFAVYEDGEIRWRVPAGACTVLYAMLQARESGDE